MWRHWPLWVALLLVAVWVVVPASRNPGQWGDHFEQFIWSHSFEWGYYKHPPLPTWLLAALIKGLGPSPYWTYLLAALCTGGTAFFSYRIALRLLPAGLVGLTTLLWGLQQAFSARAQLFNHNTVLMLAVSAAAWCVLRAVQLDARRWWCAAGLAAGAAMLSKYQALVPLGGLLVGLLLSGELKRAATRRGLCWATAIALLVFLPHLLWMIRHDFSTLRYAGQGGHTLLWSDRGLSVLSFLAQQLRLLAPALLFAGLLWLLPGLRVAGSAARAECEHTQQQRRAWFIGLIAFPLVVTLLTCPTFGLKLQNHWGFQCLQFVALWLAWVLRSLAQRPAAKVLAAALLVQLLFFGLMQGPSLADGREAGRRDDKDYPARQLAAAVAKDWQRHTGCPLKIVVGPSFEAGMISAYSRLPPKVLEGGDFRKSPWISVKELQRDGAVYVAQDPVDLPDGSVLIDSMAVPARSGAAGRGRIYWAILPPPWCANADRAPL